MAFDYEPVNRLQFDDACNRPDFHAVVTIQLCELIDAGFFDLSRADWDFGPKFSEEQHAQLCKKITEHYYYREIALVPPGIWKREFLRKMNEIMPKYMAWYEVVASDEMRVGHTYDYLQGNADTKDNSTRTDLTGRKADETHKDDEYYKSRNIFSDFPQTSLAGRNQDYASTGNDTEYERINEGSKNLSETVNGTRNTTADGNKKYQESREHVADPLSLMDNITEFDNIDATIIDEIEPLFSCLFTVNINSY